MANKRIIDLALDITGGSGISDSERVRRRLQNPKSRLKYLAFRAIGRAKRRGFEYDENLPEHISRKPPKRCPCCRVGFTYTPQLNTKPGNLPSIDRLDNEKGYTIENARIICYDCNMAKRTVTPKRLKQILKYIERETKAKS